ncbi:MAG: helix-turn-helix domain-containing protein, partial [Dactylosporangium sp.]|nr:helix-turn-helix domain-containing protein [Dactylosporangium sp.]
MTTEDQHGPGQARGENVGEEGIGPFLARLRLARGQSQLRLAQLLCAVSGSVTVTRHEISRWERGNRVPSRQWLGWLAAVLDVPVQRLESAATAGRG